MAEVELRLPGDEVVALSGPEGDDSVLGAIRYSGGSWEPHLQAVFFKLVRPDWVCLDVGANIGAHTIALAKLAAHVVAFEAASETASHLRRNLAASGVASKVQVVEQALWSTAGELRIYWAPRLAGCAFVTVVDDAAEGHAKLGSVVTSGDAERLDGKLLVAAANTLDLWCAEAKPQRLDLMKIDIEGAEAAALAGGQETPARHKPLIVTEYNPACAQQYFGQSARAYFDVLAEYASEIRVIEQGGDLSAPLDWQALEPRLAATGWVDLICAPEGRALG
jgi:FkbM family methyltransferase